jgi:hypothetical protein
MHTCSATHLRDIISLIVRFLRRFFFLSSAGQVSVALTDPTSEGGNLQLARTRAQRQLFFFWFENFVRCNQVSSGNGHVT